MARKPFAEIITTAEGTQTVGEREWARPGLTVRTFHAVGAEGYGVRHFAALRTATEADAAVWIELCKRCAGTGNFGYGPYGGVCYSCNHTGIGSEAVTEAAMVETVRAWGMRVQGNARAEARRVAARRAEADAWRAANADLVTWAEALAPVKTYPMPEYGPDAVGEEFSMGARVDQYLSTLRNGWDLKTGEAAYLRAVMVKAVEREANGPQGVYGPNVKTRFTMVGTVKTAMRLESDYDDRPDRMFLVIEGEGDHAGITLVTRSSAETVWGVERGQRIGITATVTEHGEYNGTLQTTVARPVVMTPAEAEAKASGPRKPRKPKTPKHRSVPEAAPVVEPEAPAAPVMVVESTPAPVQTAAPAEAAKTTEAPVWNPNGWNGAADYAGGFIPTVDRMILRYAKQHPDHDTDTMRADVVRMVSDVRVMIRLDNGAPEVCTMADVWDLFGMAAEGAGEYKPLENGNGWAARWDGGQSTMIALTVKDYRGETPAEVAKRLETYTTAA